jgi:hypothetical protein
VIVVTNPCTYRPLQDVGILILVLVDMGQHEPSRLDRMLHDREGTSGVRTGDLEHHSHAPERDRTAFAQLHYDRRQAHLMSF